MSSWLRQVEGAQPYEDDAALADSFITRDALKIQGQQAKTQYKAAETGLVSFARNALAGAQQHAQSLKAQAEESLRAVQEDLARRAQEAARQREEAEARLRAVQAPDILGRQAPGGEDDRVGLPNPQDFGANLEAGSPQGEETLGQLAKTGASMGGVSNEIATALGENSAAAAAQEEAMWRKTTEDFARQTFLRNEGREPTPEELALWGQSGSRALQMGFNIAGADMKYRTPAMNPQQAAQWERDVAANRRIFETLRSLPAEVERRIGGHFFTGGGEAAEAALKEAIDEVGQFAGAALERGSVGSRAAIDLAAGAAGAGASQLGTDDTTTPGERFARAAAGFAGGVAAAEGGQALARGGAEVHRPTLSEAASAAQSAPLANPGSLLTNFLGGLSRTVQRTLQEAPGGPGEAVVDVMGMGAAIPEALAKAVAEFKAGPSESLSRGLASPQGGLEHSDSVLAKIITIGTRANVATDRFWNELNEAGGMARARYRGLDELDASEIATRAAEFATYRGQASPVAAALSSARKWVDDPKEHPGKRALGAFVMSTAPYVRTPERVLASTLSLVTDPFTQPARILKALRAGENAGELGSVAREATGRFLLGTAVNAWLAHAFLEGQLRGAAPRNQSDRKNEEAAGAKWETLYGVPLRYYGTFGEAASLVASTMAAAQRAAEKGEDPLKVAEAGANEAMRWTLSRSYLRELVRFGTDVSQGRFVQATARLGAGAITRPISPITTLVGAADPYEREGKGIGGEVLNRLPGGRYALPIRENAAGEKLRRGGSGVSRAFGIAGPSVPEEDTRSRAQIIADARREAAAALANRGRLTPTPEPPIAAIVKGFKERVGLGASP